MMTTPSEDFENVINKGKTPDDHMIVKTIPVNWLDGNSVIIKWWRKIFPLKKETK